MLDLLFRNINIIDGTGADSYIGDVGVEDGKIVLDRKIEQARRVIDGTGKYLSPGFIDVHSHGDGVFGTEFGRMCKISQGITTEITGQCGSSMFPVRQEHLEELKGVLSTETDCFPDEFETFTTFKCYSEYVDKIQLAANTKILLGHGSLRVSVMGYQNRPCNQDELALMKSVIREAMENGAFGISSGLIYSPSCYADTEELIELCKVVAEYGGIYATHMRNESFDVVNAVKEALRIGKEAKVPVFISHHKVQGRPFWGLCKETLSLIEEAKAQGQKVTIDQYPYLASMTNMNVVVPPKYFVEGVSGLAEFAADPVMRERMKADILNPDSQFENQYINCGGWEHIQIASLKQTPAYDGMTIAEIAAQRGQDGFDAYFDLLAENDGMGTAIYFSMCEEDLCNIFMAPDTVVGTDGLYRFQGEKAHPRAWGTFPHAINYFHKEKKLLSLEAMIHKITLLPAERTMLAGKGAIKNGWDADIVVFDYDKLTDRADYKYPDRLTEGIEYVIVAGQIVYADHRLTGVNPGRLIRHQGREI